MVASMDARPQRLPELLPRVEHELDWLDRVITEREGHLVGQEFGRADLAAASLLAPLALPGVEPVKSSQLVFAGRCRSRLRL
jgi:glutathione S-transferase